MAFTELTAEQIEEIRSNTRRSGQYRSTLEEFINSGAEGADVTDTFAGKKPTSVAQGLKRLAGRGDFAGVSVVHLNDRVYLLRS